MPPAPMGSRISYGPSLLPTLSAMEPTIIDGSPRVPRRGRRGTVEHSLPSVIDWAQSIRKPIMLPTGILLSHYEIISLAGSGGMGEVYLARDVRLRRKVALKLLTRSFHKDDELRQIEREARAASALNHPNIVSVYDVGAVEAGAFLVMEWVEGRSLRQLAAERM